jgi:PleD family two-component response regulator
MDDKSTILIVEDDLDLAEMLKNYFHTQDYDVLHASLGKEAVETSQDADLALVVLDIRLPDIDGYEVCRQLRLYRRTQSVPIIFLTEKRDRVDKLQGLELGVVDYITKPFDLQELRLRVRNAISHATRQTSNNPVTELPEHQVLDEKLNTLVLSDESWSLLRLSLVGMPQFREKYGFVAADDVLRAVTLMIRNAVRDLGGEGNFVGHLGPEDFVVITSSDKLNAIRERIVTRVHLSREYFYPAQDRELARQNSSEIALIGLESSVLSHNDGEFDSSEAIKMALLGAATRSQ